MNTRSGLLEQIQLNENIEEEEGIAANMESEEVDNTERGNQSQLVQWLAYDDPILQIKIDYPSSWEKEEYLDGIEFTPPDSVRTEFDVDKEPLLPSIDTPQKYMREVLNEMRDSELKIISLNETTVNNYPAYKALYEVGGPQPFGVKPTTISYLMVNTDDYTGYHISFDTDREDLPQYLPDIERMVNSFQITK